MTADASLSSLPPELKLEICECLFEPLHMPEDGYRGRNVGRMSYNAAPSAGKRCRVEMPGEMNPISDDIIFNIKLHGALETLRQ